MAIGAIGSVPPGQVLRGLGGGAGPQGGSRGGQGVEFLLNNMSRTMAVLGRQTANSGSTQIDRTSLSREARELREGSEATPIDAVMQNLQETMRVLGGEEQATSSDRLTPAGATGGTPLAAVSGAVPKPLARANSGSRAKNTTPGAGKSIGSEPKPVPAPKAEARSDSGAAQRTPGPSGGAPPVGR